MAINQFLRAPISMPDQAQHLRLVSSVLNNTLDGKLNSTGEVTLTASATSTNLVDERMKKFNQEVSHWNEYNYVVINDNLDTCYQKISNIISNEKNNRKENQNFEEIELKIKELTK